MDTKALIEQVKIDALSMINEIHQKTPLNENSYNLLDLTSMPLWIESDYLYQGCPELCIGQTCEGIFDSIILPESIQSMS